MLRVQQKVNNTELVVGFNGMFCNFLWQNKKNINI